MLPTHTYALAACMIWLALLGLHRVREGAQLVWNS